MPYSMGWHQGAGTGDAPHWRARAFLYRRLLRSAALRQIHGRYEMLAEPQRGSDAKKSPPRACAT